MLSRIYDHPSTGRSDPKTNRDGRRKIRKTPRQHMGSFVSIKYLEPRNSIKGDRMHRVRRG